MLARALARSVGTRQQLNRKAAGRFCSSLGAMAVQPPLPWSFQSLSLIGLLVTPAVPAGWPEVTEMAPSLIKPSGPACSVQPSDSDGSLHPKGIGSAGTAAAATLRAVAHFLPDILPFLAPLKWTPTDRADLGGALGVIGHKGYEAGRTPISPINDASFSGAPRLALNNQRTIARPSCLVLP